MHVDTATRNPARSAERSENVERIDAPSAHAAIDLRIPLIGATALAGRFEANPNWLPVRAVVQAASALGPRPGAFLLSGGEPLQRRDLFELLAELAALRPQPLGLCTPGNGLTAEVARRLRAAGVQRVRIPFHCARQDAHDWLVERPGALKTALRAIRVCGDSELAVTAEIVVTRPTMPHLAETVEVLARIGVRSICIRRLVAAEAAGTSFVPLSPRLSLLEKYLEDAAAVALQRRLTLTLHDFPLCVAPRLRPLFAKPESEVWISADGSIHRRSDSAGSCTGCPGAPLCAGAPLDYVSRFGWEELTDRQAAEPRIHENVKQQIKPQWSSPMTFAWRGPRRVRCEACGGPGAAPGPDSSYESTRVVRARLVEAARQRPSRLRLVGADLLAHPESAALIFDALRLFPHVEVAGEGSAVVDWSESDLRRLKGLERLDLALYGPDAATHDGHCGIPGAFAAALRGVEMLREQTDINVGAYAILHDASLVSAFVDAWAAGQLPGKPRFRLSARGGSLDELIACAGQLADAPGRAALLAVLPRCLCVQAGLEPGEGGVGRNQEQSQQTIHCGRSMPYDPCGSDPMGSYAACERGPLSCTVAGCIGTAVGWHSTARAKRWMASN